MISYKKYADCCLKIVKPIEAKRKFTIGNHDILNEKLLKQYMDYFGLVKQFLLQNIINFMIVTNKILKIILLFVFIWK